MSKIKKGLKIMPTFYKTILRSDKESIKNALLKMIEVQKNGVDYPIIITDQNLEVIIEELLGILASVNNDIQEFTMQLAEKLELKNPIILHCLEDLERMTVLVKDETKTKYKELDGLEFIICALYEAKITGDYFSKVL